MINDSLDRLATYILEFGADQRVAHMAKMSNRKQQRIVDVARGLGLDGDDILPHGHHTAKIPISELLTRESKATAI
jgi:formyltetrahydrofolate synthetase